MKCWSCAEGYDDSLEKCPQCGASKKHPVHKQAKVEHVKETKKYPVK